MINWTKSYFVPPSHLNNPYAMDKLHCIILLQTFAGGRLIRGETFGITHHVPNLLDVIEDSSAAIKFIICDPIIETELSQYQ